MVIRAREGDRSGGRVALARPGVGAGNRLVAGCGRTAEVEVRLFDHANGRQVVGAPGVWETRRSWVNARMPSMPPS